MSQLILIFHGRFPSEKAAGLFADKSAQSFMHIGYETTLLAPRRIGRDSPPRRNYKIVYLPTIDLFFIPFFSRIAYYISYGVFSLSTFLWLWRYTVRSAIVYSNEALPTLLATYLFANTVYEVHDFPEKNLWMYRALFRRVRFLLATNEWKAQELISQFNVSKEKIITERNATDVDMFAPTDKVKARELLLLPLDRKIALYTGHLYTYKGVDTLAEAARLMPEIEVYVVGGTKEDVKQYRKKYGDILSLHIVGHVPHDKVPLWQSAADVLVLPNSGKEAISSRYTSPMKLFEYMASERPIVASHVPSITEIVSEKSAYLVLPDNAEALAKGVYEAMSDSARAHEARRLILTHTWNKRAQRILSHIT